MSKSTPGPWTIGGKDNKGSLAITSESQGLIARVAISIQPVPKMAWVVGDEVRDANADLIAAAPEMLAKLKSVSAWLKRLAIAPPDQMIGAALDAGVRSIDEVIAKAEGK